MSALGTGREERGKGMRDGENSNSSHNTSLVSQHQASTIVILRLFLILMDQRVEDWLMEGGCTYTHWFREAGRKVKGGQIHFGDEAGVIACFGAHDFTFGNLAALIKTLFSLVSLHLTPRLSSPPLPSSN